MKLRPLTRELVPAVFAVVVGDAGAFLDAIDALQRDRDAAPDFRRASPEPRGSSPPDLPPWSPSRRITP